MAEITELLVFSLSFLLYICGVESRELCYVDSNTGTGVYCDSYCCEDDPLYCCDKKQFIIECSVFGGFGVLFLIILITCCICKRIRRKKKIVVPGQKKTAAQPVIPTVSAATVESGLHAEQQGVYSSNSQHPPPQKSSVTPSGSDHPDSHPMAPHPSKPMYTDTVYPSAATSTHPAPTPTPS